MIEKDDWRLGNQLLYLQHAQLVRRPWRESRPQWDHDHCEFCWAKFSDDRIPDALHEGYCTPDEYRWICDPCFEDFKEMFGFTLIREICPPTIQELRDQHGIRKT